MDCLVGRVTHAHVLYQKALALSQWDSHLISHGPHIDAYVLWTSSLFASHFYPPCAQIGVLMRSPCQAKLH